MKTIQRKSLSKIARSLGVKLKWIQVMDRLGYVWDFEDEYAVTPTGQVISLKRAEPKILTHINNNGYPAVALSTCGEILRISVAQITKQVWGDEPRLPRHNCIRKDGEPFNVNYTNLVQASHWIHVRPKGKATTGKAPFDFWRQFR